MDLIILLFLGFVIVLVVYYVWKVRMGTDIETHSSVKMPEKVGEEKRQQPRADIHWPISIETPDGTIDAVINNISLSGAFICCEKPMPVGEVFHLTMMVPDNEPIAATAKVAWSNVNVPAEKIIHRGMGVRFLKMSDRHIKVVGQIFRKSD